MIQFQVLTKVARSCYKAVGYIVIVGKLSALEINLMRSVLAKSHFNWRSRNTA